MSRWREMMMDYGQIFGSDKQGDGSDVFTLNSDIKDKRKSDLQLRRTLEVHFRPLFQRFVYGGEKIACHDLRRALRDPEYRDKLPPDKIQELADVADFNKGRAISYNEFVNIVMNELPLDDLASMGDRCDYSSRGSDGGSSRCLNGFLFAVGRNTAPQEIVEKKMDQYRCLPPPFFMILITLAQILVYVIVNESEGVDSKALEGVAKGNVLMYTPTKRREAWRFFTYCLLHQGYVDLVLNIAIQLVLGIPLEMMFSWWRVAIVYITGVIVGSCGHSIADHYVGLVGAAGGSYAIAAAHVLALLSTRKYLNTDLTESTAKRVFCSISLRISIILLIVIPQICLAVYRRWFMDDIPMKIGIAAHIGGIVAGSIMSDAFLTDCMRSPMKGGAALLSLFTFVFLLGFTVIFNIASDDYPPEDYS